MSSVEIYPYNDSLFEDWDNFIYESANGTFLLTRKFLSYHPPERFQDASILFYKNRKPLALFPAAFNSVSAELEWVSHPGVTYGGLIVKPCVHLETVTEMMQQLVHHAKSQRYKAIKIRLPNLLYQQPISQQIEYALWRNGFDLICREPSTFVDLNRCREMGILESFAQNARGACLQAQKTGLTVNESNDLPQFWQILEERLAAGYGEKPTHSIEEIQILKERFPENIRLFAGFHDNQMVGGTLVFLANKQSAHTQYMATLSSFKELRPMNAILHGLIEWLIPQSYRYLNFGISTTEQGKTLNSGLQRFKESFGGSTVLRDTYRLELS